MWELENMRFTVHMWAKLWKIHFIWLSQRTSNINKIHSGIINKVMNMKNEVLQNQFKRWNMHFVVCSFESLWKYSGSKWTFLIAQRSIGNDRLISCSAWHQRQPILKCTRWKASGWKKNPRVYHKAPHSGGRLNTNPFGCNRKADGINGKIVD